MLDLWNHLILAAESGEKPADLDPMVEKALSLLGGWEQFSRTPYSELHRRYKDFKEAVESAASTHIHQEVQQLEHRGLKSRRRGARKPRSQSWAPCCYGRRPWMRSP